MNIFERAARGKYRFPTHRGEVTTEDLFDLPLDSRGGFNLNEVAIAIDNELETSARKNFIAPAGTDTRRTELEAKLEIVKHVIAAKLAGIQAAETRAARQAERTKLLDALAKKDDEALSQASRDEILAKLAELDGAPAPAAETAEEVVPA
jgi:hypothetical protein